MIAKQAEDAQFEPARADMPELSERIRGGEQGSRERGAITLMQALRRVSNGNVALVGDASGGVDAITGEGMPAGDCTAGGDGARRLENLRGSPPKDADEANEDG
jgi:hypothetical protein